MNKIYMMKFNSLTRFKKNNTVNREINTNIKLKTEKLFNSHP
jgi:hypothetical protein